MQEKQNQRFVAKFVNGYHVVFDSVNYENIQIGYLKTEVDKLVRKLNKEVK